MIIDFEERRQQEGLNLLFSYTVQEDHMANLHGYRFLGAGYDDKGTEVHVFELKQLTPNAPGKPTAANELNEGENA